MKAGTLPTTAAATELLQEMEDDAGVSREMGQGYFTLQERAPLFLIHGFRFFTELLLPAHGHDVCTVGILHLLGYDHESDEDFQTMTREEERVLRALSAVPPTPSPSPEQAAPVAAVTIKAKKRNVRKEDAKAT